MKEKGNACLLTDHEMLTMYRYAADKQAQIRILAELMLIPPARVREKLTELGERELPLPRQSWKNDWTKEEDLLLSTLWREGLSIAEIGRRLKRTAYQITHRKKALGLPKRIERGERI